MTTTIETIFNKGLEQHHYANTAYPLDGAKVWKDYRVPKLAIDEVVKEQWNGVKELGFYVHVPFCRSRCNYCEYAVVSGEDANLKNEYFSSLFQEIEMYKKILGKKTAVGLDIGGGTPTIAPVDVIEKIIERVLENCSRADGFDISIETTPWEGRDLEKMKALRQLGIERISMGIQTVSPQLLAMVGRTENGINTIIKARDNIREAGFERFNLDLMYGFAGQSLTSVATTVEFAMRLNPEYITLYRNRYKGTKLETEAKNISLEQINQHYDLAFRLLTENGYQANIGKNTFSKISGDPGTSAYLTKRVVKGTPYLGMGLAAQSMAKSSLYYNQGAASKRLDGYQQRISEGHFPIQDIYLLPPEEIMAKMICVSFYFGGIDKEAFQKKFGIGLDEQYKEEIKFLLEKGLMVNQDDSLMLTNKGKDKINGIIPLFYSSKSKENLLRRT